MGQRLVLISFLLTFASGCLTARGTAERPLVTSFEIQGTRAISRGDLEERLATQESTHFLFFKQEPHYYDADALANDTKRIERYYRSQGYYQARVTHFEVKPSGDGKVDVVVQVNEGEPVRVRETRIIGLEDLPELKEKSALQRIHEGQIFTEESFDGGRAELFELMGNNGYARAEVAQQAEIDTARTAAVVTYTVKPGERYRLGNVFVAGSVEVPRARVREAAEDELKSGGIFDASSLSRAQRRVFDLGVFGGVRVTQGKADPESRTIPVVVAVREAPFHTIRIGPGVAHEASRIDVRVAAGWTDRNWLGGLRKLNLDGRIGYAVLPLPGGRVDGFVGALTADFTQPGVIARPIDLNVRLGVERGLEQAYSFWVERGRIGLPLKLSRSWILVPSYNVEVYQLTGNAALPTGSGQTTTNQLFFAGCPTDHCVLSYLEQQIAWDGRDDPIQTRSGAYLGVALQEGFRMAGSGFRYLRLIPEARGFVPLGKETVLAARLRLGFLMPQGGDTSPIVARFNSGGPNSMRGYYSGRLSPVLKDSTVPVGGEGMADASLELRFPLAKSLHAAVFLDAGNVGITSSDALELGQLQYAAGFGLRYLTSFGPLRVDLAANLPKPGAGGWSRTGVPYVDVERGPDGRIREGGHLTATGAFHYEPIVGFHLSIGEAY